MNGDAPSRYLITCPARTGSTMLSQCLQSHPDIWAHGEVLAPEGPLAFYGVHYRIDPPLEGILIRVRDRDPVRFLQEFVWQSGGRPAVGFKGKYEELLLPQYEAVLTYIRDDIDVRVIHLTRENLLERFLSQHLAVNVHRMYNARREAERPAHVRVRLSPDECAADFERQERRQARFRSMLAAHPMVEVTYEALVGSERRPTLARIQEFLGVEERALSASSVKLRTRPMRDTIENYDQLEARFEGTPYRKFFVE